MSASSTRDGPARQAAMVSTDPGGEYRVVRSLDRFCRGRQAAGGPRSPERRRSTLRVISPDGPPWRSCRSIWQWRSRPMAVSFNFPCSSRDES